MQSINGDATKARLHDISVYGCNVICQVDWLRPGSFVTVRISQERSIQAIVRWIRGESSGIEFLRPIPDDEAHSLAELWQ
ncbi:MAG: PilZ domain-containing protein [Proteobacteria bacterium]|nr:PilZ domain-containing protein [Pseudomonadota bacterium]